MKNDMKLPIFRLKSRFIRAICIVAYTIASGCYAQDQGSPNSENRPGETGFLKNGHESIEVSDTVLQFKPGNALKISVYPDSGAFPGGVYPIDSRGMVDLPIIGYLKVIDMSPRQIELLLTEKYSTYLPRPNISVRPVYRISLLGGFLRPGLYWVDPRASLWSAVEKAGGPQREDGIGKIQWVRGSKIVTKNIVPFFQSGASLYSIGFESGDQLCVTPRPRRQVMENIQTNVLPFLTILLTTASVYATYQFYTTR
jgi:protein involved in polysaccharide export with SLBB domain